MPFISGGLTAASGIMSAIGGSGQAKANAIAARMQQEQQNFNNRWQNEAQNRNILRQWEAQYHVNKAIERAANKNLTTGKFYARKIYNNQASELSKQTRQANSAFLGSVSSRGLSLDSASARALMRQVARDQKNNSENLRLNFSNQMQALEQRYAQELAQRNLADPGQVDFIEQRGAIVDSSSSMLMTGIASSLLAGGAAGYSAYRQFGMPGGGNTGGGTGGYGDGSGARGGGRPD